MGDFLEIGARFDVLGDFCPFFFFYTYVILLGILLFRFYFFIIIEIYYIYKMVKLLYFPFNDKEGYILEILKQTDKTLTFNYYAYINNDIDNLILLKSNTRKKKRYSIDYGTYIEIEDKGGIQKKVYLADALTHESMENKDKIILYFD